MLGLQNSFGFFLPRIPGVTLGNSDAVFLESKHDGSSAVLARILSSPPRSEFKRFGRDVYSVVSRGDGQLRRSVSFLLQISGWLQPRTDLLVADAALIKVRTLDARSDLCVY